MPHINLLPNKRARLQDTARNELLAFGISFAVLCAGIQSWHALTVHTTHDLTEKIASIQQDLSTLAEEVKRVEQIKSQNAVLERKLAVIDTLKKRKTGPARLLDELAMILSHNERIWLTAIEESDGTMIIEGSAIEHSDLSEFQMALEQNATFFTGVTLTKVNAHSGDGARYLDWKIVCKANYAAG